MDIKELYIQLTEAYSDKNLNRITANLIQLYQSKQFGKIKAIAKMVAEFVDIEDEKINKCFSKLILLYHPDKGTLLRNELENKYLDGNFEALHLLSHILFLGDFDAISEISDDNEDIDYSPGYEWDSSQEGYEYFSESEADFAENDPTDLYSEAIEHTFYNAVKLRIYGTLDIEFPTYYLEDLDEIEMAQCEIDSLEGVEFCIHTVTIDLSRNNISDVSDLSGLIKLEELYLADNQIGYIDAISNLLNLKLIDLSNNEIDDISPLFDLESLEFINISGNRIPQNQIAHLKREGRIVII